MQRGASSASPALRGLLDECKGLVVLGSHRELPTTTKTLAMRSRKLPATDSLHHACCKHAATTLADVAKCCPHAPRTSLAVKITSDEVPMSDFVVVITVNSL